MSAFKTIESQQSNYESNQWPNKYCEEKADAEWTTNSVEKSVSFLDDIFNRKSSPHFCMDFEPSEGLSRESKHLFAPSHTKHYEDKLRVPQQLDDHFIRPRKEPARFDSFRNSFMNLPDATTVRERSSRFHHSDNIQPLSPYHVHLPDRRSSEPIPFLQEQRSIEASDSFPFGHSFSNQMTHPQQSGPFQSFSRFSASSAYSTLRIHQNDLTHYPPSHMLDRDSASTISFFSSPEHWSFPPMRLY
ncbi:uncharacterized protein LOC115436061 [Sphaeramia orbicularis]|uniref:uncharacterized protein LOC115436061 n=1 Tax=Sphaeramia orbicularis TaxID=375764 RepID=UPI00117F263A|nr:uncharacterized protein LOC115436061 [Sphaeramia orbicularis]